MPAVALVLAVQLASLGALGCMGAVGPDDSSDPGSGGSQDLGTGGTTDTGGSGSSVGAGGEGGNTTEPPGEPPVATPSNFLLLTTERLEELDAMVASSDPEWLEYKARIDAKLGGIDVWGDSPENRALIYLLTKDATYAEAAYAFVQQLMTDEDVRFDSYLHFGDLMRHAAIVLNYCYDALSAQERDTLVAYLDDWTHELWFENQGSGWGLEDPGNNYHHAFLEGTAYAGYALREVGEENGQVYIDMLLDKLEKPAGVLDYLGDNVAGGGWFEGTNYGERSKQRLNDTLSVVASMGGTNYFFDHPYFAQSVRFAVYELQPDHQTLYPGGDLARDAAMPVSPAERDYLSMARYWLGTAEAASLAEWYVNTASPSFDVAGYRGYAYKDLVFESDTAVTTPTQLPLSYHATGTGWINLRSGWDPTATSLTISAPSQIEQDHQHHDAASFVIFKRGWIAMDAVSVSTDGLNWTPCAHNGICVEGAERRPGSVGGLTAFEDDGEVAYIAVDATDQYRHRPDVDVLTMMNEHSREMLYVRPGTLVIYDRVSPKSGSSYDWRLHLPVAPTPAGNGWQVSYAGAGLTMVPILGQVQGVESNADLLGGPSASYRLVALPATPQAGRLLNVVAVADGAPPVVTASAIAADNGSADGVALSDTAVIFSRNAEGAPAQLPFSYTVPGTQSRLHVIANLGQSVNVSAATQGSSKVITVAPGSAFVPSPAGTVRIQL